MCARYVFVSGKVVNDVAGVVPLPDLQPSWNIGPGQWPPVVAHLEGVLRAVPMQWGMIPLWMDPEKGRPFVNARAESAHEKPSFRAAYKYRRCAVPLDGWYEWSGQKGAREPWYFTTDDGGPLLMAGLYEDREGHQTFCVLTRPAAPGLDQIHDRMPCLLHPLDVTQWLDPTPMAGNKVSLLDGVDWGLKWHRVHPRVGKVSENDRGLVEPLEDSPPAAGSLF